MGLMDVHQLHLKGGGCGNGEAEDVEKHRLKKARGQEDMVLHEENISERFYDDFA